jgi:hypothetical protein
VAKSDVKLAQEPPKKVKGTTEERVRSGEENRLYGRFDGVSADHVHGFGRFKALGRMALR